MKTADLSQASSATTEDLLTRLTLALDIAQVGTWSFEPPASKTWDDRTKALFGISPGDRPTSNLFYACLHPDDRERCREAFTAALDPAGSGVYACEFRIHRADNDEERWLSSRGRSRFEDGRFVRIVGVVTDITEHKRGEFTARAAEDRVRRIIDGLFAFVGILDCDGTLREANRAPLERAGMTLEDVVGKKFWDCYWWSYDRRVQTRLKNAVRRAAQGERVRYDVEVRAAGGDLIPIDFQIAPLRDAEGRVVQLLPSAVDVAERNRVEQELRASEQKFRELADNMSQFAWMAQGSGYIYWYNRRWFEYTGTSLGDMEGWGWTRVHHPDHIDRVVQKITEAFRTGTEWEDTFPLRGKDGGYRWFLSRAIPIRDAKGDVVRWFGTNTDVTDLRESEIRLREGEARFRVMADHLPQIVWLHDANGAQEFVNQTFCDYFGVTREEMRENRWRMLTHPDDGTAYADAFLACVRERRDFHAEVRVKRNDGEWRWIESWGRARFDKNGHFLGHVGTSADVTERKAAEANLRHREMLLSLFIENAPAAIAMLDTEMRYLAASRRYSSDFGVPPASELVGRSHDDVFPDIPERFRQAHARALAGKDDSGDADPFPREDGRLDWVRWSVKPWRHEDGSIGGILLFTEIITEVVESRRALEDSEQRFRGVFDRAACGIATCDSEGLFQQCNPAFLEIVGFAESELHEMNLRDLVPAEDRAEVESKLNALLQREVASFEIVGRYLCKGGKVRWTRRMASILRHLNDKPAQVLVVVTDMDERIAYEQKIGLLLREVNHRSKNMLAIVQAIARNSMSSDPGEFNRRFSQRIGALAAAQELLVSSEWAGVDLAALVHSQLLPFAVLPNERIDIGGPPLLLSPAAAQSLGMALHELATNAVKHGALSTDSGRVMTAWSLTATDFQMTWTERDGPKVEQTGHRGFGSTVLDRMMRMAFGGQVNLEMEPDGLVWRLSCPLEKLATTGERR